MPTTMRDGDSSTTAVANAGHPRQASSRALRVVVTEHRLEGAEIQSRSTPIRIRAGAVKGHRLNPQRSKMGPCSKMVTFRTERNASLARPRRPT
ncbi:hypothetical protein EVAR_29396_1 [Eumeta japonica]|uniref:Uncharacterized protein n=1 Tax=Eumeta variegata TaxID=151549 RepID=A0A4C1ZTD6_EUMVA|nr:hypothetical protein EVAR_29396_1 [Eumeta japonica]